VSAIDQNIEARSPHRDNSFSGLPRLRRDSGPERDTADVESNKQVLLVVNAVKGDPAEGEDGELYEAMGYVRKSERSTGKTNKTKPAPVTATAH
jgi:hypothetical protein